MNIPNFLTLLRIVLAPVFMFFFLLESFPMKALGLGLFVFAALTDLADGYYARKRGVITGFGKFMDPLADKILVSSALISFTALRYVSPIPVALIIGREFLITGLRLVAAYKGVIIPPTLGAKIKTFLQMWVVGLVLAYVCTASAFDYYQVNPSPLAGYDAVFYTNWLMWITAVVTVWTGIDYIIKYYSMVRSVLR
jgi:CDP-diacylglycerol--glycerol-3-phosphate 3-phosphatidyltransferase